MNSRAYRRLFLLLAAALIPIFFFATTPPPEPGFNSNRAYAAGSYNIFLPVVSASITGATIAGCPMFPLDNPWNRDVSNDPVDPNSANLISSIGASTNLHPDFGSNLSYGIPYTIVPSSQISVPVVFGAYASESDPGPYPIPANAPIESGSDAHVLVAQSGTCKLFEMGNASKDQIGSGWHASGGAVFNFNSNALRPQCWTSADAAGLPILPGLVRYDEVQSGEIKHAIRFTVVNSRRAFIHPATHYASSDTNLNLPPMGMRVRLKAGYNISTFYGNSKIILTALKKYGMFVADNGSNWYITGSTDGRWNDTDLNQMKSVPGSAFEVVKMGTVYTSTACL